MPKDSKSSVAGERLGHPRQGYPGGSTLWGGQEGKAGCAGLWLLMEDLGLGGHTAGVSHVSSHLWLWSPTQTLL
jgi:hypothetical protein